MIVRQLNELTGTDRDVRDPNWSSRRLLLQEDGMGFSLHDTLIHAGTSTEIHYRNHLEAVYCIEGKGQVKLVESGKVIPIEAGTVYALDQHDHHILTAETDMRMVCVFAPALVGPETHDETHCYPLLSASVSAESEGGPA